MTEKEAYVAFNLTENIGSVGVARLAARYGSVAAAWEAYPKKASRSGKGEVDWRKEIAKAESLGVKLLTPADGDDYPPQLRSASGHPLCLYVKGNCKVLSRPSIAMVGTRRATPYGRDQAYFFGRELSAASWTIVSGLAFGIDAESHKGALANGVAPHIGVIGSALNEFYPEENVHIAQEIVRQGGAVVSEFPFGRKPDQTTFPQRNHVVAALARGVLVVEAPIKSGTMITAGLAADLGRQVMAIPGRVDSPSAAGCLKLIRDGATLVRTPEDVIDEMGNLFHVCAGGGKREEAASSGGRHEGANAAPLSVPEAKLLRLLDSQGIEIDELVRKSGLGAAQVNSIAMALLVKGRVRFLPGNRVALPRGES